MISIKHRLLSNNLLDKIAAICFGISVILFFIVTGLAINNYEHYSNNFYYYAYLVSVYWAIITMINVTRDYYSNSNVHKGTLKYFVMKINPARTSLATIFSNIGGGIYFIAFLVTGIVFMGAGEYRPFLFTVVNFLLVMITVIVEVSLKDTKVSERELLEFENVEDVNEHDRKIFVDSCLKNIDKYSCITRIQVLQHAKKIFRSQELDRRLIKRKKDAEHKIHEKTQGIESYRNFINKHNKE